MKRNKQKILVFQQNGQGESKIQGILKYGDDLFELQIKSINVSLPDFVDNTYEYLPEDFQADIVLDFLTHPDLSYDLAVMCQTREIPVVASGKKPGVTGVFTPPT